MSEVKPIKQYPPTLCWDCANSTGGCRWSKRLKPIPGWKIVPTKRKNPNNVEIKSCIVLECPEFKRDAIKNGLERYKEKDKD